jgi:hypothetical protein
MSFARKATEAQGTTRFIPFRSEALCKVLCHNLCVVIQSMYELGIDATFTAKAV